MELLALEQTIKILAEKSNAGVEVFDRAEFELDIVTAVSNAMTQNEKISTPTQLTSTNTGTYASNAENKNQLGVLSVLARDREGQRRILK